MGDGTDASPDVDGLNVDASGTTDPETVESETKSSKKKKGHNLMVGESTRSN